MKILNGRLSNTFLFLDVERERLAFRWMKHHFIYMILIRTLRGYCMICMSGRSHITQSADGERVFQMITID